MTLDDAAIDELARIDAAREQGSYRTGLTGDVIVDGSGGPCVVARSLNRTGGRAIVSAVNALALLVAEVRRLRAENASLRAQVNELRERCSS